MWVWIKTLDRILRGEATRLPELQSGKFDVPLLGMAVLIDLLGLVYGVCMGIFSLTPGGSGHPEQMLATMVKVPSLFLLTLTVTLPSLYVFNAMVGSRLMLPSMIKLLIAALAVMLAVLASIGPIVAFFSFTTTSYPFMVLLNVLVFAVAGFLGLAFLLQTLHRLTIASEPPKPPFKTISELIAAGEATAGGVPAQPSPAPGPLDLPSDQVLAPHVKIVFRIWVVVFGLVGSQMAWVLRPFIGRPGQKFTFFRPPESNFFQAVIHKAIELFS